MSKILLRSITPKPGAMFDLNKWENDSAKAINDTIKDVSKDFKKTYSTWSHKPSFSIKRATKNKLVGSIETDDEIYNYVVRGTRRHVIRAKKAPMLRFQTGYRAKTKPGKIGSSGGGATGPFVSAKSVMHPGTEARNFDKIIATENQPKFRKRAESAIKKAAK